MPRRTHRPKKAADDPDLPKYSIAVASDLSGVPQQQLRRMEEAGLVAPTRTDGKTRRYSDNDLARIDEVNDLASEGVNAAGIHQILALRDDLRRLRADNEELARQLEALRTTSGAAKGRQPGLRRHSSASGAARATHRSKKQPGQ